MKKSKASIFFERKVDITTEKFISKNIDIAVQVLDDLKELGWSQKEFAQKMDKSEAEISKWLSGTHNLTLKSIAKMETVLGKEIILVRKKHKQNKPINYFQIKDKNGSNHSISIFGDIELPVLKSSNEFLVQKKQLLSV